MGVGHRKNARWYSSKPDSPPLLASTTNNKRTTTQPATIAAGGSRMQFHVQQNHAHTIVRQKRFDSLSACSCAQFSSLALTCSPSVARYSSSSAVFAVSIERPFSKRINRIERNHKPHTHFKTEFMINAMVNTTHS